MNPPIGPTALVVAHPGHELRLFRWLELVRPVVFVLTDGSGSGRSRTSSSRDLHRSTGSTSGSIMAPFTDVDLYAAMLSGDPAAVASVTLQLCDELIARGIRRVVVDAFEFYNPSHDLCAVMARLAVARAEAVTGTAIERCDYAVTVASSGEGEVIDLDPVDVDRKLAAAYAFENLTFDVNLLLEKVGIHDLEREIVRPLMDDALLPIPHTKPLYEIHGEERVAQGRYSRVLRYEEHFVPFVQKLIAAVAETPAAVASNATA